VNNCKICLNKALNFFCNVKHFKYYLCHNCGTLQLSNLISINSYKKNYKYIVDNKTRTRLVSQSKLILNYIKNNINNPNSLLDIGSGYGYFLKQAKKHYSYTVGLEPSLNLFNYSKKVLKNQVLNQSFESFYKNNSTQKFDAIALIHVIEHIKNPKVFLNKVLSLLKIGGILYIETPNLSSYLFKAEQKNYTFLTPPEHIYIFSKKSFKYLIKNKSHQYSISTYTYSYNEHIVGILKAFFKKNLINLFLKLGTTTFYVNDRSTKMSQNKIRNTLSFILIHKIFAVLIRPLVDLMHKGTFLQLYIKKNR